MDHAPSGIWATRCQLIAGAREHCQTVSPHLTHAIVVRMSDSGDAGRAGSVGLVIDDYMHALADVRERFRLPTQKFGLRQIVAQPGAKAALDALLKETVARHGSNIFAKTHPLLAELGSEVYAEKITTAIYSGYRIRSDALEKVMQRAIEIGLQTIVQLPARHPKPISVPKRLKATAKGLKRTGERLDCVLGNADVTSCIGLWDDPAGQVRLRSAAAEIRWAAEALQTIAGLKLKRVRGDSPNPQVSTAMYILGWVEVATARPNYERLATLVHAAFSAAGKSPPKWADRLSIEMLLKRQRRKKWAQAISSKS